ncbi:MAG: hypothetical protein PHQ53_00140 [Candidatus Krumholzibacteria bacterium]|nr:hypothetical protein [Candidatus Krumholzibacteria bacterium]
MSRRLVLALTAAALASACHLAGCGGDDDPASPPAAPPGWVRTYGSAVNEIALDMKQTTDGGCIITGWIEKPSDPPEVLLLKIDAVGDTLWAKSIPGASGALGRSIVPTADGGYLLLADCWRGANQQFWLIKTDALGNTEWEALKGYSDCDEQAAEVLQTSDGGYIVMGTTDRAGHDDDIWLVKTDAAGGTQWYAEKGYDDADERGVAIEQTADGGYLIAAFSNHEAAGGRIWLLKLFADGNNHWMHTVPTQYAAYPTALSRINDGTYVVMGDVTLGNQRFVLFFNYDDAGNQIWSGGAGNTGVHTSAEIRQTTDGGWLIAGSKQLDADDSADFWAVRFDADRELLWEKTFGSGDDWCYAAAPTADGGCILCGRTRLPGVSWSTDVLVVRTDADGEVD